MLKSLGWSSTFDDSAKAEASLLLRDCAQRLRCNPGLLQQAVRVSANQSKYFQSNQAAIHLDFALLFGQLWHFLPTERFDIVAHRNMELSLAANGNVRHFQQGMFGGLAQLGTVAAFLSQNGTRYQKLLLSVDAAINEILANTISSIHLNSTAKGISVSSYDLISGITGVGAYLLLREQSGCAQSGLSKVLECLCELAQDKSLRHFITPRELQVGFLADDERFRLGLINTGLAHGVPGVLSLLSLAYPDYRNNRMGAAIETLAQWLIENCCRDKFGLDWPVAVPVNADGASRPTFANRPTWCYGSPGVISALHMAGEALNDQYCKNLAVTEMQSTLKRYFHSQVLSSPIICHGVSGLLQIVSRLCEKTNDRTLTEAASKLFCQLMSMYNPDSLLGFQDVLEEGTVDDPTFLNGFTGIILVLSGVAGVTPVWDRMLLLS